MSTVPLTPSTERTRCGWLSRTGMQSVMRTVPVAVSNSVSSTSESARYHRRVARMASAPPAGAIFQKPWASSPRSREKHDGESKCGRHIQSTDPSIPTRAAVCRSPMTA